MRPRVNTKKHYRQLSLGAVASGAITPLTLVEAVAAPSASHEVVEGAIVSAIYIEMWLTSDDTAAGTAIVTLEKIMGGGVAMTTTESAALADYDNKKNVLHTQMGLLGPNVQVPLASVKGWFKIPKGKQRFGLGDRLVLNLFGQSNGLAFCGFATYKEQL